MFFSPRYSILGRVAGTDLYLDVDTYKEVRGISIQRVRSLLTRQLHVGGPTKLMKPR